MLIKLKFKLPDTLCNLSRLFQDQDCGDHSGYSRNRRRRKTEFLSLSHKYNFSDIIVPDRHKEGSTAGLCQAGLVLHEVDEHIGGAIQGGQEVGQVGQIL